MQSTLKTLAATVLKRAANTFWQAASATAVTLFLASGIAPGELVTGSGWSHLWSAVIVGALASGLSAVKTLGVGFWLANKSRLAVQVYAATAHAATTAVASNAPASTISATAMEAGLRAILDVLSAQPTAGPQSGPAPLQQAPAPWEVTR